MLGVAFAFTVTGAMLTAVFDRASQNPALWVVIGFGLTLAFGVPITAFASFSPALKPIEDLAEGTKRVAVGDYSQRMPVVQDDDLGALAASFNRMQAELAGRQRLSGGVRHLRRPCAWRPGYSSRVTMCSPVNAAR